MDANDYAHEGDAGRQIARRADPQGGLAGQGRSTANDTRERAGHCGADCGTGISTVLFSR